MRIQYPHDKTVWNNKEISICMWYKYAEGNTTNTMVDIAADLCLSYTYSSSKVRFNYWRAYSNNGTRTGDSGSGNYYDASQWHHVVLTCDHGINKIYVDGILDATFDRSSKYTTNWVPLLGTQYNLIMLAKSAGSSPFGSGYLNDVRIYDHCLSAAEVHDIAQGLVLHYPLDKKSLRPIGTNLVTGVTKGGRTTVLTDGRIGVQTTGENSDTYFTVNLSESITSGTTYYLSCDASGISDGQYWGFPLGAQNNSSMPSKFYNGHNEYIFTANDIDWGTNRLFLDDIYRLDYAHPASFYNFVLIKNPTFEVIDNSGYGHNATLTNGSLATANTVRYSTALSLGSSTKAIGNPIFEAGTFISEYTWTGWLKRNYTTAASRQIHANIASINLYTDFTPYLSWTSGKVDGSTTGNGAAGGTATATLNEWIHMAITYKNGIGKFYINGELIKTFNYSDSGVYIAAAANNTLGNGFIGELSDIRIYMTQLLDTDIKSLYNIGMRIDNLGNVHTFELIESNAEHITKSGQLITNGLEEINENKARLTNGDGWQSSEFIEI